MCTFLEQQSSVDAQLMLVAFCLQNSRHAQAMHAYEKVKPMAKVIVVHDVRTSIGLHVDIRCMNDGVSICRQVMIQESGNNSSC